MIEHLAAPGLAGRRPVELPVFPVIVGTTHLPPGCYPVVITTWGEAAP
jgi:hypothetical protein